MRLHNKLESIALQLHEIRAFVPDDIFTELNWLMEHLVPIMEVVPETQEVVWSYRFDDDPNDNQQDRLNRLFQVPEEDYDDGEDYRRIGALVVEHLKKWKRLLIQPSALEDEPREIGIPWYPNTEWISLNAGEEEKELVKLLSEKL